MKFLGREKEHIIFYNCQLMFHRFVLSNFSLEVIIEMLFVKVDALMMKNHCCCAQ